MTKATDCDMLQMSSRDDLLIADSLPEGQMKARSQLLSSLGQSARRAGKKPVPRMPLSRRSFLQGSAAGLAAAATLGRVPRASADAPIYFETWSAAVDTVKSHIAAFEAKTGLKVMYSNTPWAQYREKLITEFVGGAPIDTLWVSDSWLPEWAEAGWIKPVNQYQALMKYNDDVEQFCIDSMTYKGKQYGITYYTDFMGFIVNDAILQKASINNPPTTWAKSASKRSSSSPRG